MEKMRFRAVNDAIREPIRWQGLPVVAKVTYLLKVAPLGGM